jgi:hypothetical protein
MSKAIFKLLLVSGLTLTLNQTSSAERHGPRREDRVRFQRDTREIDKELDAIDQAQEFKRQRQFNELPAEVGYHILRAPLKPDPSSSRKIKTQRLHFKNLGGAGGTYISATFTDSNEADLLRAALSPTFATYIEEIGDYDSPQAKSAFEAALTNVRGAAGQTDVHPNVTFIFHSAIDIGVGDTETAILLQNQGKRDAKTDKILYQATIGEREVKYLINGFWRPANLLLNVSYDPPKKRPAQVIEIRKVPLPSAQRPSKERKDTSGLVMNKDDAASVRRKAVMILPEPTLPAATLFRLLMNKSIHLKPTAAKLESVTQRFKLKTVNNIDIMLEYLYTTLGTSESEIKTLLDDEINLKFPDLCGRSKGDPEDYDFGQTAALAKKQGPAEGVIQLYEVIYKGQIFTYTPPKQSTANKANFRASVTTHHAKPAEVKVPAAESSKESITTEHS